LVPGGQASRLAAIDRIEEALHPSARAHHLGDDVLFDCDLSAQRVPVWRASKEIDVTNAH
jgi:diaminohydroxyphosphoribosylaminopyrimidine deaminase/5-amino-6-(5-phosphoribosylamino)uracil reductase